MWKKLFSMIILALFVGSIALPVFAAVNAQSAGTNLGVVERVNFSTGLTATKAGDKVTVVVSGDQAPTSVEVGDPTIGGVLGTNYVAIENGLEVDGDIYFDGTTKSTGNIFADGSIYMTTASPAAAAGVGLWISQPDGGCSKCYVDDAGTTWACANATCPTGM